MLLHIFRYILYDYFTICPKSSQALIACTFVKLIFMVTYKQIYLLQYVLFQTNQFQQYAKVMAYGKIMVQPTDK